MAIYACGFYGYCIFADFPLNMNQDKITPEYKLMWSWTFIISISIVVVMWMALVAKFDKWFKIIQNIVFVLLNYNINLSSFAKVSTKFHNVSTFWISRTFCATRTWFANRHAITSPLCNWLFQFQFEFLSGRKCCHAERKIVCCN